MGDQQLRRGIQLRIVAQPNPGDEGPRLSTAPTVAKRRIASEVTRVDQRGSSNEVVDFAPRNPDIPELPVAQALQRRSQALADTPGTKGVKISPEKAGRAPRRYGGL